MREYLQEIYFAAVEAVSPRTAAAGHMDYVGGVFKAGGYEKLLVAGFGKAAALMAQAAKDAFSDLITGGAIVTKYGHVGAALPGTVEIFEASHPVPDSGSVLAARRIMELVSGADEKTLILCLISGGGSALLALPRKEISLDEKIKTTELLLNCGADINEVNAVRKHLSLVKGGRLAEAAYRLYPANPAHRANRARQAPQAGRNDSTARIISLIISDVVGNALDAIASGPTAPDTTTHEDALRVLDKYGLEGGAPRSVLETLKNGAAGLIPDTPKPGSPVFENVENIIIADNSLALSAAAKKAQALGFDALALPEPITGRARGAALDIFNAALRHKEDKPGGRPLCLISGGETTVKVTGRGRGGRNMELALAFAIEARGIKGITLLSAGTDGTDGPTDSAGAFADGEIFQKARDMGINPSGYLEDNNSYEFFERAGGLFKTGPTGTNVMDVQIMIVE
jgi:glycerate-2-kinase